jgi:hypothetical protein
MKLLLLDSPLYIYIYYDFIRLSLLCPFYLPFPLFFSRQQNNNLILMLLQFAAARDTWSASRKCKRSSRAMEHCASWRLQSPYTRCVDLYREKRPTGGTGALAPLACRSDFTGATRSYTQTDTPSVIWPEWSLRLASGAHSPLCNCSLGLWLSFRQKR